MPYLKSKIGETIGGIMKKKVLLLIVISAILLMAATTNADRGHISVTARAEIYDPPGPAKIAPMFTIEARYRLSAFIAATASGSWTQYSDNDANITFIPVSVAGEVHPFGKGVFDPYAGMGIGFNFRQFEYSGSDDEAELNLGLEFLGGVTYKPKNQFGFAFQFKYRIEDIANAGDTGSWSFGGGVTGSWEKDL